MPPAADDSAPTPRGRRRTEKLLDAALVVFIEQGYEGASVNEIVRRAGGSLATLYKRFGSKEGLFVAMIERRALAVFTPLEQAALANHPPAQALHAYGLSLLELLLAPEALATYRLVINEAHRHPALARRFLEHGPFRVRRALADYLAAQAAQGRVAIDDCWRAAAEFSGMLLSDIHLQALVGLPPALDAAARDRRVAATVERFLHGVTAREA